VSLTPPKNLSVVSLTPLNSFSQVLFTLAITLIREYLREFSKKFKTAPMEYLWAWGTLIYEKNRKLEILVSAVSQGFLLLVFFMNLFPTSPRVSH
jgi:hypothetical protein